MSYSRSIVLKSLQEAMLCRCGERLDGELGGKLMYPFMEVVTSLFIAKGEDE